MADAAYGPVFWKSNVVDAAPRPSATCRPTITFSPWRISVNRDVRPHGGRRVRAGVLEVERRRRGAADLGEVQVDHHVQPVADQRLGIARDLVAVVDRGER